MTMWTRCMVPAPGIGGADVQAKGVSAGGGSYPGGADRTGVECAVLRCVLYPQGRNADWDGGVPGGGYGDVGV